MKEMNRVLCIGSENYIEPFCLDAVVCYLHVQGCSSHTAERKLHTYNPKK